MSSRPPQQIAPDFYECFLAFELSEASLEYAHQSANAICDALREKGWPVYCVRPEKWHVSLLSFESLSVSERRAVWEKVEVAASQGVWKSVDFRWVGFAPWPRLDNPRLVVLESQSFPALTTWGLQSWTTDSLLMKGDLKELRSYRPHNTVIRFTTKRGTKPATRAWAEEWAEVIAQQEPIDLQRIWVDRLSFLLISGSGYSHRYIREHTVKIE